MTTPYTEHTRTDREPTQKEPIPGKRMKANAAGGFSFAVDDWQRLERFLILGTEKGSYYASEHNLTIDNAEVVRRCIAADGNRTVALITAISRDGRAPKNDQAVFALGMCIKLGNTATRTAARSAVPLVCRIGTHIFQLAETIKTFGGWGRWARRATSNWYKAMPPDQLAMNLVKYQNRNGWTHKDLLRKGHTKDEARDALFRWVTCDGNLGVRTILRFKNRALPAACKEALRVYKETGNIIDPAVRAESFPEIERSKLPAIINGFEEIQRATDASTVIRLILQYGLPRECVPTQFLQSVEVWDALLRNGRGMPYTAMIRNLGKMSEIGLLKPLSSASKFVVERLADTESLRTARVHPIAILLAQSVYAGGHGLRGNLAWEVDSTIVDALNDAFYGAFKFVEPTGKRFLLGIDVSSSMDGGNIAGSHLTPREAAAAMALVTANVEKQCAFIGYSHRPVVLDISPKDRLDRVIKKMQDIPFGGTDASIPMVWAKTHNLEVDVFHSYTDSETWAGPTHPSEELKKYRTTSGLPAKLIVVGFTATEVSIADPNDSGMLDVVGFDTAAPEIMANFARM